MKEQVKKYDEDIEKLKRQLAYLNDEKDDMKRAYLAKKNMTDKLKDKLKANRESISSNLIVEKASPAISISKISEKSEEREVNKTTSENIKPKSDTGSTEYLNNKKQSEDF